MLRTFVRSEDGTVTASPYAGPDDSAKRCD